MYYNNLQLPWKRTHSMDIVQQKLLQHQQRYNFRKNVEVFQNLCINKSNDWNEWKLFTNMGRVHKKPWIRSMKMQHKFTTYNCNGKELIVLILWNKNMATSTCDQYTFEEKCSPFSARVWPHQGAVQWYSCNTSM